MNSAAKMQGHRRFSSIMANNQKASKPESERDSGFSDASSGYLSAVEQTDSEDLGRLAAASHDPQAGPQVSLMPGSYPGLSPMIIMNNIVLKQPNTLAPALKPWGFPSTLEMIPPSPVVLLQPMVSNANGSSQNRAPDKQRRSRKYLPILKSFPKIAPHPGQGNPGPSTSERNSSSPGHGGRHRRRHRDDKPSSTPAMNYDLPEPTLQVAPSNFQTGSQGSLRHGTPDTDLETSLAQLANPHDRSHPHPTTVTFALGTGPGALLPPHGGPVTTDDGGCDEDFPEALSPSNSKRKRFCNTYNILSSSGLLGITLRTKELIRQNRRSQAQLLRLQAQTELFLQAVSSGDPQAWTRLQLTLQEPGPGEAEGAGLQATGTGCRV